MTAQLMTPGLPRDKSLLAGGDESALEVVRGLARRYTVVLVKLEAKGVPATFLMSRWQLVAGKNTLDQVTRIDDLGVMPPLSKNLQAGTELLGFLCYPKAELGNVDVVLVAPEGTIREESSGLSAVHFVLTGPRPRALTPLDIRREQRESDTPLFRPGETVTPAKRGSGVVKTRVTVVGQPLSGVWMLLAPFDYRDDMDRAEEFYRSMGLSLQEVMDSALAGFSGAYHRKATDAKAAGALSEFRLDRAGEANVEMGAGQYWLSVALEHRKHSLESPSGAHRPSHYTARDGKTYCWNVRVVIEAGKMTSVVLDEANAMLVPGK